MQARMKNPVQVIPESLQAIFALNNAIRNSGLPKEIGWLVELRASQINGCGLCVDLHSRIMKKGGETDERIFAVAAWREAPFYSRRERAALALAEAVTRLSDRPDPVSDEVWKEAAAQFNETELSGLLLAIGVINVFNRLNVATKQIAGEWAKSADGQKAIEMHAAA